MIMFSMGKAMQKRLALIFCMMLVLSSCSLYAVTGEALKVAKATTERRDIGAAQEEDREDDEAPVLTMYLTVRRGNKQENTDYSWDEVNGHPLSFYEELGIDRFGVEAIVQIGSEIGPIAGELGYGLKVANAVVQVRGINSSKAKQKSYKISLKNNSGPWQNQKTIVLNKCPNDGLRLRSKLAFDLMNGISDLVALRTQFVHLYVKDETKAIPDAVFHDYGLFTQVEQPNKFFLRNNGFDSNGQLYKAVQFDFTRYSETIVAANHPTYDRAAFEAILEIKGDNNHTKLINMLEDLNDTSISIEAIIQRYFDEDNYLTWLVFQLLTNNIDASRENFYLYSPTAATQWFFLSWDLDGAFKYQEDVLKKQRVGSTLRDPLYEYGISAFWGSTLHRRVLLDVDYRTKLQRKAEELYVFLTGEYFTRLLHTYQNTVRRYIFTMPDIMHAPLMSEQFDTIAASLSQEVVIAYELFRESFRIPSPFLSKEPVFDGENLVLAWEDAVSFENRELVYSIELARDYLFTDPLYQESKLDRTSVILSALTPGQYFYRVEATDSEGYHRYMRAAYEDIYAVYHEGVQCFYVLNDGMIALAPDALQPH